VAPLRRTRRRSHASRADRGGGTWGDRRPNASDSWFASTAFPRGAGRTGVSLRLRQFRSDNPAIVRASRGEWSRGDANPSWSPVPKRWWRLKRAHGYAQAERAGAGGAGCLSNVGRRTWPAPSHRDRGASRGHRRRAPRPPPGSELKGSRNEFIQWIQDVFGPARPSSRGYVKGRQRDPQRPEHQQLAIAPAVREQADARSAGLHHGGEQR